MKNTTTIKIPKKYHDKLELVEHDSDGYWAYCEYGYRVADMGCHFAHEDTQKELLDKLKSIEPCDCQECREELAKKAEQAPIELYHCLSCNVVVGTSQGMFDNCYDKMTCKECAER